MKRTTKAVINQKIRVIRVNLFHLDFKFVSCQPSVLCAHFKGRKPFRGSFYEVNLIVESRNDLQEEALFLNFG